MSLLATAASYYVKLWNINTENNSISIKEKSSCMPHGSTNITCMEWNHDCKYYTYYTFFMLYLH